jgi:hypothetical protein
MSQAFRDRYEIVVDPTLRALRYAAVSTVSSFTFYLTVSC